MTTTYARSDHRRQPAPNAHGRPTPSTMAPTTTTPSTTPSATSSTTSSATPPAPPHDRDAHLLRLVLDLQLDALMLAIGAAAAETVGAPPTANDTPGGIPWERWVGEDVDLTRELAVEAITGGAALPAVLGPATTGTDRQMTLDRLIARYESMRDLLRDLLSRGTRRSGPADGPEPDAPEPDAPEPDGPEPDGPVIDLAEPLHLRQLLAHCHTRLVELRGLLDRALPSTPVPRVDHTFLPGELLG